MRKNIWRKGGKEGRKKRLIYRHSEGSKGVRKKQKNGLKEGTIIRDGEGKTEEGKKTTEAGRDNRKYGRINGAGEDRNKGWK